MSMYLNFGAGNPVKEWVNLDRSPLFRIPKPVYFLADKLHLTKRSQHFLTNNYQYHLHRKNNKLPFENNSFKAVYTSHTLEHLTADEVHNFIKESHRVLIKGGVVRVVVPDMEKIYNSASKDASVCWFALDKKLLTIPHELRNNKIRAFLEAAWGFPSFHKTILFKDKIELVYGKNWIVSASLKYLESKIDSDMLEFVENKGRTKNAVIFELQKIRS